MIYMEMANGVLSYRSPSKIENNQFPTLCF